MLEAIRLSNKVVDVRSIEELPKFPDTNIFYYVNSPSPSWWRWHYGEYCEYEQSLFPGKPHLVPKMAAVVNYPARTDFPKMGKVGVKYCVVDADIYEEYFWDRNTGNYISISSPTEVIATLRYAAAAPELTMSTSLYGQIRNVRDRIDTLYDAIAHGDEKHRIWLKAAIAAHFGNQPLPEPY